MKERLWIPEINKILVCIDTYERGVPTGRFHSGYTAAEPFESLTQFLLKMEDALDDRQLPQAYTTQRTFSDLLDPMPNPAGTDSLRKGHKATFEISILFRQHTSWQGMIRWQEGNAEQSFRSALELIRLMDSALRRTERNGTVSI